MTGASSGIGRAMAGFLAQAVAAVVLVARRRSGLDSAADEIERQGGRMHCATAKLAGRNKLPDFALCLRACDRPGTERRTAGRTAVGSYGGLQDLTGIAVLFASPACNYVTGQTLHTDGGITAR